MSEHVVDGHLASIGIKGLFGGKTYFDHNGHMIGHTEHNRLGGRDVFHGAKLVDHTVPFRSGATDPLHPGHSYTTIKGIGGEHVQYADGSSAQIQDLGHGFASVMSFSDPLMHLASYTIPHLHFT